MAFEFALHVPGAPLERHVELLTFYADFDPQHDREKLLPEGAIQIIVDLTDRPKKLYAGETSPVGVDFSRSWISGITLSSAPPKVRGITDVLRCRVQRPTEGENYSGARLVIQDQPL